MSSFISDKLPAESNRKFRDWRNQECGAVFFFDSYTFTLTTKFPNPPSTPSVHLRQGEFGEAEDEQFLINNNTFTSVFMFFCFFSDRKTEEGNKSGQSGPFTKDNKDKN